MTRAGRCYIGAVTVLGVAGLIYSLAAIARLPLDPRILPLALLTIAAGFYPVRVPGLTATIYLSETFFFAIVLLFGGELAAVLMALDGLLISRRRKHDRFYWVLFNLGEPVISVLAASAAFYTLYGGPPMATMAVRSFGDVLLPTAAMASAYFLSNGGLTALAMRFESGALPYGLLRRMLTWLSLNYFGGASVALLLAYSWETLSLRTLAFGVPVVVLFWLMYKTWKERATEAERHLSEQKDLAERHLHELHENYMQAVAVIAVAIDGIHEETHDHVRRVRHYALRLAKHLGITDKSELLAIELAALLHDIGKLRVPERIWHKPGRLTSREYEQIKGHAAFGADLLGNVPFLQPAKPIVRHHHENWDGSGYPDKLKGAEIPLGARILALADGYDALTDDREYRKAYPAEQALAIIRDCRGKMYDPAIADAFFDLHDELVAEVEALGKGVQRATPAEPPAETRTEKAAEMAADGHIERPEDASSVAAPAPGAKPGELSAALLALSDLAGVSAGHTALEDLAAALGARVRQAVPCDLVVFYLCDEVTDDLKIVHGAGTGMEALRGLRLRAGEGLSGWVAANQTTIVNSSGALDFGERRHAMPVPLESALATPLCAGETVVGVLTLYAAGREAFTIQHRQVVEFVARQIGPAIEAAISSERKRMASLFDAQTGLPNEKYLERVLESSLYGRQSDGPKPGVLLLTDAGPSREKAGPRAAAGAAASSARLLGLATTCRMVVRVTDLVFRTGPDEVAILMTDGTPETMACVARRIAEAMGGDAREGDDSQAGRQSGERDDTGIEAAFAIFPEDAAEPAGLLSAARAQRVQTRIASQARTA